MADTLSRDCQNAVCHLINATKPTGKTIFYEGREALYSINLPP